MNRRVHLHTFDTHKEAVKAFNDSLPENAIVNRNWPQYRQGNEEHLFHAAPDIAGAYRLAGMEFVSMKAHESIEPEVESYLLSRVRQVSV